MPSAEHQNTRSSKIITYISMLSALPCVYRADCLLYSFHSFFVPGLCVLENCRASYIVPIALSVVVYVVKRSDNRETRSRRRGGYIIDCWRINSMCSKRGKITPSQQQQHHHQVKEKVFFLFKTHPFSFS